MLARITVSLLAALSVVFPAHALDIRVLAPNAVKEAVSEAISVFEMTTGHKVTATWTGTEAITRRVAEGEAVDVVVNAAQNIERQSKDGKLVGATRTDFARSAIGAAASSSAAKTDVSDAEALKKALLAARSVVVSSGTSGRHMIEVFDTLGIGDQLKAKTRQPPSGAQIADLLISGDAELGFQQISELLHVKGIRYLGPLPADLQNYTVYSAAVHVGASNPDAAKSFLTAVRSATVAAVVRASGMEPVGR